MSLTEQELKKHFVTKMLANGGKIPELPDGPYLEEFDPLALSQALDAEVNRCMQQGWTKVTVSLDPVNAQKMAAFLRRASLFAR